MCTAVTYRTKDFYFGRNLDYDFSYGEEVVITPRRYKLHFRHMEELADHYGMIGMAHVAEDYPLYYEGVNEKGLGIAGLNFVGNAHYTEAVAGKDNVAVFELIPWILGRCASVEEARTCLKRLCLVNTCFSQALPPAQLHWLIADRKEAIVLEAVEGGIRVHENPTGVLTNNPPFEEQMFQLNRYMSLSPRDPENRFSKELPLYCYSRGMGALGLPGDLSSTSRFVRAAFTKMNSVSGDSEEESVSQFFHILGSVDQQRGCCQVKEGAYEITLYTCCCNADKGIYYYTTYGNRQITAVKMHQADLEESSLLRFPLVLEEQIRFQNRHESGGREQENCSADAT